LTTFVVGGADGDGGSGPAPAGGALATSAPLNSEGARGGRYGPGCRAGCGCCGDAKGGGDAGSLGSAPGGLMPGGYRFARDDDGPPGGGAANGEGGPTGAMAIGAGTIIRSPHCGQFVGFPACPSGTRSVARHKRHWSETDMT